MWKGLGFRVEGCGFRVVEGLGLRVEGLGLGFRVRGKGCERVLLEGFRDGLVRFPWGYIERVPKRFRKGFYMVSTRILKGSYITRSQQRFVDFFGGALKGLGLRGFRVVGLQCVRTLEFGRRVRAFGLQCLARGASQRHPLLNLGAEDEKARTSIINNPFHSHTDELNPALPTHRMILSISRIKSCTEKLVLRVTRSVVGEGHGMDLQGYMSSLRISIRD